MKEIDKLIINVLSVLPQGAGTHLKEISRRTNSYDLEIKHRLLVLEEQGIVKRLDGDWFKLLTNKLKKEDKREDFILFLLWIISVIPALTLFLFVENKQINLMSIYLIIGWSITHLLTKTVLEEEFNELKTSLKRIKLKKVIILIMFFIVTQVLFPIFLVEHLEKRLKRGQHE